MQDPQSVIQSKYNILVMFWTETLHSKNIFLGLLRIHITYILGWKHREAVVFFNYFKFFSIQDLWHKKILTYNPQQLKDSSFCFWFYSLEVKYFLQFSHFSSAVLLNNDRSIYPICFAEFSPSIKLYFKNELKIEKN